MSRTFRNRALMTGLSVTLGVATLGGLVFNAAQAETSFGANRVERAQTLAAALDAYTEAARTCDLESARVAYDHAESIWNAIEIDSQFASADRFLFFDVFMGNQVPSSLGLEGEVADDYTCDERVALAEDMVTTWDEVITFLTGSPEDGPLFNDVATLRTINQGLRLARAELSGVDDASPQTPSNAPDPAGSKEHWLEFVADYPVARELIAFRNPGLATEIDGLMAPVSAAFEGDEAQGYPGAADAMTALNSRFGVGLNTYLAAAKNHIPTRPTFDPTNWEALDTLDDVLLTIFEIRDLITAGTPEAAAQVVTEYNDWLQFPLSQKLGTSATNRADVSMTTAVNNYAAAQTEATTRSLRDQLNYVEQIFVGQYWGTPELVQYYADNNAS